jgi:hypothetical protein
MLIDLRYSNWLAPPPKEGGKTGRAADWKNNAL